MPSELLNSRKTGFDAFYCMPGKEGAHEKGGVEHEGGRFRRTHLVPVPEVETLAGLNEQLAAIDAAEDARHVHGKTASIAECFAGERELLSPLPEEEFDYSITLTPTVRRDSRIVVRQCYYSVPARFIGRQVRVSLRANELLVFDGRQVIARYPRLTRRYDYRDTLDHYLEILQVRPGALAGSVGLAQARADGSFTAARAAASGAKWTTTEPQVPDETASSYDGAGRITESDFDSDGTLQWKTTWSYAGADEVTVTPPRGGTVTSSFTDARGRLTQLDQYHCAALPCSAGFDGTAYTYGYVTGGQQKTVTDAGGNQWTWTSDLLGRQVSATDPDTGTATQTWNDLSQLTSATDGAGKTVSFTYDHAGRKTAEYASAVSGQSTATQLAAWAYDTATLNNPVLPAGSKAIGQLATAASYVGGTGGEAYKQAIGSYDPAYHPAQVTWTIPRNAVTGALGGATAGGSASYQFGYSYNIDGAPNTVAYPASGPLAAETVNYGYDSLGFPYSAWSSSSDYAEATVYSPDGQPAEIDLGTSTSGLWSRMLYSYDPAILRLTEARIQRESNGWANDSDISYGYDPAGNVTSAEDAVTGNYQCYSYDYLARLTGAWAQPAAGCPATAPGASGLGGPAPYQQTLSYDTGGTANGSTSGTTGNITNSTLITGSGSTATTTATGFSYPASGAAQPHAPSGQSVTVNGGTPTTSTLNWAGSGEQPGYLASQSTGATTQYSYNWDGPGAAPGQLNSATTSGTTTNYRYDATGNLLVVQDGGTSTLYLPGEQITATSTAITGTVRYYTYAGKTIAARTSATALDWLIPDPQGTATTLINTTAQALTRRYYTPYGVPLGTPPAWPGNQGFIGGTTDTTTNLTNLGAREYNPATPLFIAPDPILNPAQPQDLNPYAYAADNPATNSDPSGLCPAPPPGGPPLNCNGLPRQPPTTTTTTTTIPVGIGSTTTNGNGSNSFVHPPQSPCAGPTGTWLDCRLLIQIGQPSAEGIWQWWAGTCASVPSDLGAHLGCSPTPGISFGANAASGQGGGNTPAQGQEGGASAGGGGGGGGGGDASNMAQEAWDAKERAAQELAAEEGSDVVNAIGEPYPKVIDPRTGEPIPAPPSGLSKVPVGDRVPWGAQERAAFIKEWYDQGYSTPEGGWSQYDIHHIIPREYGGTNDFDNLVPVLRTAHQQELNLWWLNYGG